MCHDSGCWSTRGTGCAVDSTSRSLHAPTEQRWIADHVAPLLHDRRSRGLDLISGATRRYHPRRSPHFRAVSARTGGVQSRNPAGSRLSGIWQGFLPEIAICASKTQSWALGQIKCACLLLRATNHVLHSWRGLRSRKSSQLLCCFFIFRSFKEL